MHEAELADLVAAEIRTLHGEFQDWFCGESSTLDRVEAALSEHFTMVSPNGAVVDRNQVMAAVAAARGSRPVAIHIENPTIQWHSAAAVLVTYEEWQDHEAYTTARRSTALLTLDETAPGGLLWRHVHETWMNPPPSHPSS